MRAAQVYDGNYTVNYVEKQFRRVRHFYKALRNKKYARVIPSLSTADTTCDERSEVSLQSILRATGVPLEQAEKHATIIQVCANYRARPSQIFIVARGSLSHFQCY